MHCCLLPYLVRQLPVFVYGTEMMQLLIHKGKVNNFTAAAIERQSFPVRFKINGPVKRVFTLNMYALY